MKSLKLIEFKTFERKVATEWQHDEAYQFMRRAGRIYKNYPELQELPGITHLVNFYYKECIYAKWLAVTLQIILLVCMFGADGN